MFVKDTKMVYIGRLPLLIYKGKKNNTVWIGFCVAKMGRGC